MYEVEFIEQTDQLNHIESFVNTGMNLTEVKNIRQEKTVKEKDFIIPRYTQTNEQVSLMFVMNIKKNVVAKMNDGCFV